MSLSDYEKEVLENLEQQFESQPEQTKIPAVSNPESKSKLVISPRKIALSIILVLLGLVVLLFGMHYGIGWGTLIGVAGFLIILIGVIFPFEIGRKTNNS